MLSISATSRAAVGMCSRCARINTTPATIRPPLLEPRCAVRRDGEGYACAGGDRKRRTFGAYGVAPSVLTGLHLGCLRGRTFGAYGVAPSVLTGSHLRCLRGRTFGAHGTCGVPRPRGSSASL